MDSMIMFLKSFFEIVDLTFLFDVLSSYLFEIVVKIINGFSHLFYGFVKLFVFTFFLRKFNR